MAEDAMGWKVRETKEQIGPGHIMMDDWELKEQIGKGSFGEVWLAEKNIAVKDESAIKIIRIPQDPSEIMAMRAEGLSADDIQAELRRNVENAIREIRTMIELRNHPAIVPCESFDVIQYEEDKTWEIDIRMQRMTSLADWAAAREVNINDVIQLGISLSDLLSVCEEKKIMHRDIKPSNIFVDQMDNFRLGDFGLARVISGSSSAFSKGVGTEAFMAPEVFSGDKYDHRADIYSLGLVMYWLLNHQRLPFFSKGISRGEAISKRLSGEVLPALHGVDPALDQIIHKACDPNPNKRWKTAFEFHNALQNVSAQLKSAPSRRKRKTIIIIGTIALAVLLSGYALVRLLNGLPLLPVGGEFPTESYQPNIIPTIEPIAEPMEESTAEPTAKPMEKPTAEPTAEPTPTPTPEPTPTPSPTAEPATADTLPVGVMLNRHGIMKFSTYVYADKSMNSNKKKHLSAGEYIYVIMNEPPHGGWSRIRVDGQEGYVISEYIYAPTIEPATADTLPVNVISEYKPATADTLPVGVFLNRYGVMKSSAYIFANKSAGSNKKLHLSAGDYIYLIMNDPDGKWSRVSVDGQEGYMSSSFIYVLSVEESNAYNEKQSTPAPVYTK